MKVKELIEFLQTQPQDIEVAFMYCSEARLLETKDITIESLGVVRPDGWVPLPRPDRANQPYLMLPGN